MLAIIVQIKAKPECVDQLLEALADNAKHSNQEPGCRKWEYSRRLDDPTQFAIYEIYDDAAAIQAHLDSEHFKRWFAVAPTLWESKESARYEIL
ncbi:MAG: antibiotic biosynthesis monooxygenase [Verrucomicrobiales bacterium]|nr:antibiotic biosynthesis monooxygenase [Verrucomicrobiales bacterium]